MSPILSRSRRLVMFQGRQRLGFRLQRFRARDACGSDQARTNFALIESDLEVIQKQLSRLPTRRERAGTARHHLRDDDVDDAELAVLSALMPGRCRFRGNRIPISPLTEARNFIVNYTLVTPWPKRVI
jgi:hypothetical protein